MYVCPLPAPPAPTEVTVTPGKDGKPGNTYEQKLVCFCLKPGAAGLLNFDQGHINTHEATKTHKGFMLGVEAGHQQWPGAPRGSSCYES